MTHLRALLAVAVGFLIAYAVPKEWFMPLATFSRYDIPAAILFAVIFGMFTFAAVDRRQRLKEAIAVELNKLRRIYHLGKNLGSAPYLRGWFTDLHGYVYNYLSAFDHASLADYDRANPLFRKLAYHIYTVPELKEVKDQVLYNELLEASSLVSDARGKVFALHQSRFSKRHWSELALVLAVFIFCTVAATTNTTRFFSGGILSLGLLLALFFFTHDVWTKEGDRLLAKEYLRNIARLELRRD
jgi:hypothetical protein